MLLTADTIIRLLGSGASLLLLLVLLAGRVRPALKVPLAGLIVGGVAYLLNRAASFAPSEAVDPFVDLMSLLTPFWIWLFSRRLFEREPPRWFLIAFVAVFVVSWFSGNWIPSSRPVGYTVIHIAGLALVADLLFTAWSGRGDDLLERRRMIRLWLPILVGLQVGGILAYELITGAPIDDPVYQTVNGILIFALTLFCGVLLLKTDAELLLVTEADGPADTSTPQPEDALTASESVLRGKLDAAMEAGFYRTAGLTIAGLASHLDTPEHRLRALINRRLGWRNFSSFLNSHRIAEAKRILADSEHVDLPVLTMAMDLGYNSLPTFNRAFRASTGQTPSDYRQAALGGTEANANAGHS